MTQLLGGPNLFSREEVEKLGAARERYFGGTGAPVAPLTETCPVTSEPAHTCACGNHRAEGRDRFWVSREELEALIDEAVKSAKVRS